MDSASTDTRFTPALTLFWFLEACSRERVKVPSGTKHITCDYMTCTYLANQVLRDEDHPMSLNVVRRAFEGLPIKQVHGVVMGSAITIPDLMERDSMLRRYADKREEREEMKKYGGV